MQSDFRSIVLLTVYTRSLGHRARSCSLNYIFAYLLTLGRIHSGRFSYAAATNFGWSSVDVVLPVAIVHGSHLSFLIITHVSFVITLCFPRAKIIVCC